MPVSIGGGTRGATVPTSDANCADPTQPFPISDAILHGGLSACAELNPACDSNLSDAVGARQLGHLAAQTLSLTYSIAAFPGFGSNSLGPCEATYGSQMSTLGLTSSSDFQDVLDKANDLIDDSTGAGSSTQAEVIAMTTLIGQCVNKIDSFVSVYPSGRGDSFVPGYSSGEGGFPFLALLGGVGVAIAVAAVITPGIKARRWRRPNWW